MQWTGTWTALVTPFKNGQLDESAFRRSVERQIQAGIQGLVPCGSTGEASSLTREERLRVVGWTLEQAQNRVPILAGASGATLETTIELARDAEKAGASAILVVTPAYVKPTQEGLYRYFRAVAESVTIDICLYNVPGRTAINLEPDTVERLCEVSNITAIKEATGNLMIASEIFLRCGSRMALMSGDDFTTLGFIAQGGQGVISVVSNLVPDLMGEMVDATLACRWERARALHYQLYPLMKVLFIESNPIPAKAALAYWGLMEHELRLPLCELRDKNRETLHQVLQQYSKPEMLS